MPIGGFVVTVLADMINEVTSDLANLSGVEVHGSDGQGNIIVVMEAQTSKEMEKMVKNIQAKEGVLSVGLTYLNVEDEK